MSVSRRDFLKAGAMAASVVAIPRPVRAALGARPLEVAAIASADVKRLALQAIDAAAKAGAVYADVRLAHSWERGVSLGRVGAGDHEWIDVGVRALVRGYWGFASGPIWSAEEMARLGREAVHQATTNALGKVREVHLAPAPSVVDGHWIMPVEIDPFDVSPLEMNDFLQSLAVFVARTPGASVASCGAAFLKQEKAFASSDGAYCTQRLYRTGGNILLELKRNGRTLQRYVESVSPAGVGWELFRRQPLRDVLRRELAEMERDSKLPLKAVDVGRFRVAISAAGVAGLLDETLGRATQLDRALGYEANADGTSFISAPLEMIGSYRAGAPALTITANRSQPGGAATVKWDDEGVAPDDFTLVRDGILNDFQTTRESAAWLAAHYAKGGRALRSHGCANSDSAVSAPMPHAPNLVMAPGREAVEYEDLVARVTDGIALEALHLDMDFQSLNGLGTGRFYEVKKGKRTALLITAGMLFRAPELWKSIVALGGSASARRFGLASTKGEPRQTTMHSVTAVPALFNEVTLIDPQRKA